MKTVMLYVATYEKRSASSIARAAGCVCINDSGEARVEDVYKIPGVRDRHILAISAADNFIKKNFADKAPEETSLVIYTDSDRFEFEFSEVLKGNLNGLRYVKEIQKLLMTCMDTFKYVPQVKTHSLVFDSVKTEMRESVVNNI